MSISSTSASKGVSAFAGRLRERIEIDDDDVDEADALTLERGEVVGAIAARQDAGVNRGVERLHPAVHHFGEAGDLGDARHAKSGGDQHARGAAGRDAA